MTHPLRKRSLQLAGHRTSIALEPEFWMVLETMALARGGSLAALVLRIDAERGERPLASACRVAALAFAHGEAASRDGVEDS
ncbi:ribbon-helix-helix domain-containing protein [Phenylobacterium sp. LjRoot219]|uniref:ribbon-helix-helix domain-containing protein n=1 Tax=Phenylobacterium sp. LjRoot219 TaxID=3342283 RepID=UPI003ECD6886